MLSRLEIVTVHAFITLVTDHHTRSRMQLDASDHDYLVLPWIPMFESRFCSIVFHLNPLCHYFSIYSISYVFFCGLIFRHLQVLAAPQV